MKSIAILKGVALAVLVHLSTGLALAADGETTIEKWRDDKKAVFLLMFDDSWPSQWQMAVPAIAERKLTATFYICPGKGEFLKFKGKWAKDVQDAGMVLGNHTMTHGGVKDADNADAEIGGATKAILEMSPGKNPRLISFAQPGVPKGKWNITGEQYKEVLARYNLIDRPTFAGHGAVYHLQKPEQMLALADSAIAKGEMEYLVVHGVERRGINWGYQDMWPLNFDILCTVLDGLKERQDKGDLWVTDHISWYRYKAERKHAAVKVLNAGAKEISVELTCSLDHDLYDLPLTLTTTVPADWKTVAVSQKDASAKTVDVKDGKIRFEGVPNAGAITLARQQ